MPGRLFLSMAVSREFEGNTDEAVSGTLYLFSEDGKATIETKNYRKSRLYETEADVSGNYEMYPEFSQYERLIRAERQLAS